MTTVIRNELEVQHIFRLAQLDELANNFDKEPTPKSANPDLIAQCIESKKRHNSVNVKIVQYHKSPLLIETHDTSTEAMKKLRQEYNKSKKTK